MGQPSRGHPKYPLVLVLLPTRELAQQVQEVSRDYCQILNLSLTCLFGGAPKNSQLYDLQRGAILNLLNYQSILSSMECRLVGQDYCSKITLIQYRLAKVFCGPNRKFLPFAEICFISTNIHNQSFNNSEVFFFNFFILLKSFRNLNCRRWSRDCYSWKAYGFFDCG